MLSPTLAAKTKAKLRAFHVHMSILFVLIAYFPPAFVIPILFPSSGISSGGLDVPIRRGTNPDITPCRRNSEPLDAQQSLFVANRLSLCIKIFEFLALASARKTALLIAHIAQARVLCCFERISSDLRIPI